MAVKVGSARIDENGNATGGKAGDQIGKEVSTQNWYLHKKGWRVFRVKDPVKAAKIAVAMQAACDNSKIGYDQYQRNTLYTQASKVGFDISKVTVACETDCSALVRVCCAYAGIMGLPSGFRTGNMPKNLLATGEFVELTGSKYTNQSDYLGAGDILVTKSSGHTIVVLTNGNKYEGSVEIPSDPKSEEVVNANSVTITGGTVNIRKGPGTSYGVLKVARKGNTFQRVIDTGWMCIEYEDAICWVSKQYVQNNVCTASSLNVRQGPGTNYQSIGRVKNGYHFKLVDVNGWIPILIDGAVYWVSAKYAK